MKIYTDSRCVEYSAVGHPERPQRVAATVERLRGQTELPLSWGQPGPVKEAVLLRAHTEAHLKRLNSPFDFDADTPVYPDLAGHALRAVGGALSALGSALEGEAAFSLMRPPGHHATQDQAMGFCYLNNIAIAVLEARARGLERVAVLDFDVHHGNGTEAILLNQPGCATFSIHQHPAYPGTGIKHLDHCFNYPVPPLTPRLTYRKVAEKLLSDLREFKPDLLAVSAGFDSYKADPLAQQQLEVEDFHWWGEAVQSIGAPHFSVLEGGYSPDLPELILAYMKGLEKNRTSQSSRSPQEKAKKEEARSLFQAVRP